MDVSIIETSGLGDRSYLITHGDIAVVIDPQRDIDRVLDLAAERGVQITHVLETHIHNDYVTGGLELARTVSAEYVVPAGDQVDYERRPACDGDVIDAGPIQLEVMHTPGHTHHHVSYVLRDITGAVAGVFTGGSMLHGTTGRTDLLGAEHTHDLTRAQYHSVHRLAAALPDATMPRERWPWLEIRVDLDAPRPDLRARIETALDGKPLRLLRIHSRYPNASSQDDADGSVDLDSLTPQEIFGRTWQARYGDAPPEDVMTDFASLLQQVQDAESQQENDVENKA